jgi:hypothetical protein
MNVCPIPNGYQNRGILLYIFRIVENKVILLTVLIPVYNIQVADLVQFI